MNAADFLALRTSLGLSQAEMAEKMDMSPRTYFALEADDDSIKRRHVVMAERVALDAALEQRNPMLAPASIRRACIELNRLLLEA